MLSEGSVYSATRDGSEQSPVSPKPESTATVVNGTGGLWWRYESLGEGVVKDRMRNRASASRQNGVTGSGCDGAADGLAPERSGGGGTEGDEVMMRVNCPIRVLDPKHGVYECHPLGKEAQTVGGRVGVVCSRVCGVFAGKVIAYRTLHSSLPSWVLCGYGLASALYQLRVS